MKSGQQSHRSGYRWIQRAFVGIRSIASPVQGYRQETETDVCLVILQVYTPGYIGSGPLRGRLLNRSQSLIDDTTHGLFYFETTVIAPPEKAGHHIEPVRVPDRAEMPEHRKSRREVESLDAL